jgi:hypothetical protein
LLRANAMQRSRDLLMSSQHIEAGDRSAVTDIYTTVELEKVKSISQFAALDEQQLKTARSYIETLADLNDATPTGRNAPGRDELIYSRNPAVKGPMHAFDYSYIEDKLGAGESAELALDDALVYEALNLVDGERTVSDIRDWLVAEFAPAIYPIAIEDVEAYLAALDQIGVIQLEPAN